MTSQNTSLRFFTAQDADPNALAGERVAVLGYGYLGRAFALNLRENNLPCALVTRCSVATSL